MKAVVGLGNPGPKYRNTRHNVGFQVIGELAHRHGGGKPKIKFEAELAEVIIAGQKTLLVAPQTYMNASGRCAKRLIDFFQLPLDDMLIVCDDLNLDLGRLRMRSCGSAGGQKGLQNLIDRLGTEEFARLRIGIGRPPGQMDATDYVLGRFRRDEPEVIEQAILLAADGIEMWIDDGVQATMNYVNAQRLD